MLPYDYSRCQPELATDKCQDCARYADHPDQTWGPYTPFVFTDGPLDDRCQFIPADREDGK